MSIRVAIADDHAVVRQGLRTFLELQDGMDVVGEAADGEGAVALVEREAPDVVLLDLVMPKLEGLAAIPRIRGSRSRLSPPRPRYRRWSNTCVRSSQNSAWPSTIIGRFALMSPWRGCRANAIGRTAAPSRPAVRLP